jgi:hypothetical protein
MCDFRAHEYHEKTVIEGKITDVASLATEELWILRSKNSCSED